MRIVGWDTETFLIRPGCMFPPIVCLTYQVATTIGLGPDWDISAPAILHGVFDGARCQELLTEWLTDENTILVGQNVAFDLGVICAEWPYLLPHVANALESNRITDTRTRQYLVDIGDACYRGHMGPEGQWIKHDYSLEALARRRLRRFLKKDGFRLFYAFFRGVPLDLWPSHAKVVQGMAKRVLEGTADEHERALFELHAQGTSEKDRKELIAADPDECIRYPLEDARTTLDVYLDQEDEHPDLLVNQWEQARTFAWTTFTSGWGLRTNARSVGLLQQATERMRDEVLEELQAAGFVRKDGSRDTKRAMAHMVEVCGWHWDEGQGKYEPNGPDSLPLRVTAGGGKDGISLDSDACKAVDDELLGLYAQLASLTATLNKDVPALARATLYPVHTNFGLAETGRRTSSNPNVQNWAREQECKPCEGRKGNKSCNFCRGRGKLAGIRECFVPRPGCVFIQADYSGLELCTLAQACLDILGHSRLALVLNEGRDAHTEMACLILGITYEEGIARKVKEHPCHQEFDRARQTAKVANFGFPGGLGAKNLVKFARKTYRVWLDLTDKEAVDEAKKLKRFWESAWPEMPDYFAHVNSHCSREGGSIKQLRSNRVRSIEGPKAYTALCNSFFQGLGADATGHAGWLVWKACYVDRESPLYGSRIVNYIHDEIIAETPEARAPAAAEELSRLMVLGASKWIPDIKLQAEPCIMTVWSKEAKTLRDERGQLKAWAPEGMAA